MRNIEIKTKLNDSITLINKLEKITKSKWTVIEQHDTFFNTKTGRLKLRQFKDKTGEIIYYERPNIIGPKLCNYQQIKINAETFESLKNILTISNGIVGVVKKTRRLFIIDQTRIHIDDVHELGSFLELEVILNDDQDVSYGEKIAQEIMKQLDIEPENLISEAYVDLLNKAKSL
ncbi:hypothetical protein HZH66_009745 [Vespula vulgaris]|uniref:CYTH domain-containing protein n=1 Tax=Vespula vulgaris TaxID=7454 RepID=A0A834N0G6_VESVU|nr:uncharacterized protein LOC127066095 [Vespula vulgaris]KAF7391265.1 hypothetical protein HZH66_009745 [Vespula vulgaris]